jgi:hypothetical protein
MMHGPGKSDSAIVAVKPTIKAGRPAAEPVERRAEAEENAGQQHTRRAQDAAPGVDGLTWRDYEADLDRQIVDLHARVHRGAYRALPSRRRYIPKADGQQRPLAVAALEDKIVSLPKIRSAHNGDAIRTGPAPRQWGRSIVRLAREARPCPMPDGYAFDCSTGHTTQGPAASVAHQR